MQRSVFLVLSIVLAFLVVFVTLPACAAQGPPAEDDPSVWNAFPSWYFSINVFSD